jgi:anti-anti-sigma regulatory factor
MATAPATPVLKVARTASGYCIRVEGRGTLRESRSAVEFAARPLDTPGTTLVVDLAACEHLDSTFLGCIVEMQRRAARAGPGKFVVSAPPDKVRKLFGPTKLDAVLRFTADAPQVISEFVPMPAADPASPDVMRHVMECHRLLAELGGPQQAAFAAIADHLERELKVPPQPGARR